MARNWQCGAAMVKTLYRLAARERPLVVLAVAALVAVGVSEWARPPTRWHPRRWSRPAPPRAAHALVPDYFRRWRAEFLAANRPRDNLGLVRGIFLGDDSEVPASERERFRAAGLSHLLAASGFNCWIVAAAFGLWGLGLLEAL